MKDYVTSSWVGGFALLALVAAIWIASSRIAAAQNTAFTYQGRLSANGSPANGLYDFTFQAFDSVTAGASIGGTVNVNGVGVTNGLFAALVDLGSAPFTGPARWLQIRVSTNGAGSFFTTLAPRQALTPSPYAIYANTAGTVTNGAIANAQLAANSVASANIQNSAVTSGKIASGQVVKSLNGLTDAVSLTQGANVTINTVGNSLQISAPAGGLNLPYSGSASSSGSVFTVANSGAGPAGIFLGNVGIGRTNLLANLHIITSGEGILVQGASSGVANNAYISFANSAGTRIGYVGDGASGDDSIYLNADSGSVHLYTAVGAALTATPMGNVGIGTTIPGAKLQVSGGDALFDGSVGIGTTTPTSKLEVRGDIRLGPSGQLRAVSGEENLRIVRGRFGPDLTSGTLGSGYTVSHPSTGSYTVFFDTPFAGTPVVTATVDFAVSLTTSHSWAMISGASPGQANIEVRSVGTVNPEDHAVYFIAIGPR